MKTPLFDLKEDLIETIETGNDALNDIENIPIRDACKKVLELTLNTIIKRIDEELLPKEKEVIEKACIDMVNIALDNVGNKNVSMQKEFETYFNETFTQK
jgi:altronate dehydratase